MSKLTSLSKLPSVDRELLKVQQNVEQAFAPLTRNQLTSGILLQNISLVSGDNSIEHKLLRKPIGYLLVSNSVPGTFSDNIATTATKLNFTLNSSANMVVTLWVF